MNSKSFSTLKLPFAMLENLKKIGFLSMTPIQAESLPLILKNTDVIAQAKTGSGKTASFGIGILNKLDVKRFKTQALVLCPTRELADQVAKELRLLAKFQHNIKILTLCGGVAFGPQLGSLRHGTHIVVGTPGRVLKHLNKESLKLDNLQTLVLDEADRMLDMGFIEEITNLISFVPKERQTLLFSATYPDEILSLSKSIQKDAINIKTSSTESKNRVKERFYEVQESAKVSTLIKIFANFEPNNAIVFCNTKIECDEVAKSLQTRDIDALALHGDLEQYDRNDVLVQFANGSCRVLVATDVAARGLDIKELSLVVNYELPHLQETYTHRIGRTARAGAEGLAFTFYSDKERADEYKNESRLFEEVSTLKDVTSFSMKPRFVTLVIEGGKKDKLRAGDILGSLTSKGELSGADIGKIDIYDRQSYVAIKSSKIDEAYKKLTRERIKTKKFSVWILD